MPEPLDDSEDPSKFGIELRWQGPFTLIKDRDKSLFSSIYGGQRGIYLLTFQSASGFRIYSCGFTNISFKKRFSHHLREFRKGRYNIFDTKEFGQGIRKLVRQGFWYKKIKTWILRINTSNSSKKFLLQPRE